eukprot:gene24043-9620_t
MQACCRAKRSYFITALVLAGILLTHGTAGQVVETATIRFQDGHTNAVGSVAFSPTNTSLLASGSSDNTSTVTGVTFSKDGSRLASSSWDSTVKVWDVRSARLLTSLTTVPRGVEVLGVSFSMDGRFLAAGTTDPFLIGRRRNLRTKAQVNHFKKTLQESGIDFDLSHISFQETHDRQGDHFAYALKYPGRNDHYNNGDETFSYSTRLHGGDRSRDQKHGDSVSTSGSGVSGVSGVSTSSSSSAFTFGASASDSKSVASASGLGSGSGASAAASDESSASASASASTGKSSASSSASASASTDESSSGRSRAMLVTGSYDGSLRLWDSRTYRVLGVIPGQDWITSLAWSVDGRRVAYASASYPCFLIASGSDDRTIRLWNSQDQSEYSVFDSGGGAVTGLSFSANGAQLASSSALDNSVRLWAVPSGQSAGSIRKQGVRSIAFSPTRDLLVVGLSDTTIEIRNPRTLSIITILQGHAWPVVSLSFSVDGNMLVTSDIYQSIRLWGVNQGRQLTVINLAVGISCYTASFSADNRFLALGWSNDVLIWDVQQNQEALTLRAHDGLVRALEFTADRRYLASASQDNSIIFWKAGSWGTLIKPSHTVHTTDYDTLNTIHNFRSSFGSRLLGALSSTPLTLSTPDYDTLNTSTFRSSFGKQALGSTLINTSQLSTL